MEKLPSSSLTMRHMSDHSISPKSCNGNNSAVEIRRNPSSKRLPAIKSDSYPVPNVSPLRTKSPTLLSPHGRLVPVTEVVRATSVSESKSSTTAPLSTPSQPTPSSGADAATLSSLVIREGKGRWVVRNQHGTEEEQLRITIDGAEIRDSVRVEKCEHVYVDIVHKVNAVTILGCTKTQVAMQSVIASLEITRCSNTDVQIEHVAPTVNVDNSSCINMYLMDRTQVSEMDIVTSCSSAININVRPEKEDENVAEYAIPQQFVSKIVADEKGQFKVLTQPREGC